MLRKLSKFPAQVRKQCKFDPAVLCASRNSSVLYRYILGISHRLRWVFFCSMKCKHYFFVLWCTAFLCNVKGGKASIIWGRSRPAPKYRFLSPFLLKHFNCRLYQNHASGLLLCFHYYRWVIGNYDMLFTFEKNCDEETPVLTRFWYGWEKSFSWKSFL